VAKLLLFVGKVTAIQFQALRSCYTTSVTATDPYHFPGSVPKGLDPDPTLMSTTKLTGMENLTIYVCCLSPGGPTDKKNKLRSIKKKYPLCNSKDPDPYQTVGSGSKSDPDLY
jgi:hypothetical protein